MNFLTRHRKKAAFTILIVMVVELVLPVAAYGLTSGPTQPEMKGFEPIGNSDMVDLFSGDFSYNIPLMDVGGYPVNMSYHSGANMDEEASWVGYGWSLNAGTINRQMRGMPDDFNGTDQQEREMNMKDHITKGAKFSMTLDAMGVPVNKIIGGKKKKKLNLQLTLSVGIKHDNYRGIGMEMGANAGVSLSSYNAGENTNSDSVNLASGNVGLNLSSMDGASVSVNPQILRKYLDQSEKTSYSKSVGFGYNSRAGLTGMTIQNSVQTTKEVDKRIRSTGSSSSSFLSFNGESYSPGIDHPTRTTSFSLSIHLGPQIQIAFPGVGLSGFYSRQKVDQTKKISPAFGYLFSENGKDNPDALMDFNREKEIPYNPQVSYLPIPIPTYDLYTAASQDGSGQYRSYKGSSGVFFDNRVKTKNEDFSLGIEVGVGTYFDLGADLYHQSVVTKTEKWTDRNAYLTKGDFQPFSTNTPSYEPSYFKRIGEPVPLDQTYLSKIKGTSPVAVSLPSNIDNPIKGAKASDRLRTKSSAGGEIIDVLKRNQREVRNTTFSYLNASEAAKHGLEKDIIDYKPDSIAVSGCSSGAIKTVIDRKSGYRKKHHISEITITGDDGKKSIYGIPVYNTYQEEVTFSTSQNHSARSKGLVSYTSTDNSKSNNSGRDNYFSKEKTAPYATSYLLTSIVSPDYTDITGNGISDDDQGTTVKFNYTQLTSSYKWRTPFAFGQDTANYNEGFLSDALDDKANYVYGEKEIWYLHSIESKTMVAHFITENRDDGLGVTDNRGGVNSSIRLKRLKEIRLYSKSDLRRNGNDPAKTVPIKVAHFVYDYSLCKGLPNSISNTGKLTLKRVYFTFGLNNKGVLNPYDFEYDTSYNFYAYRQYDRWGNFKDAANNPNGLNNSEFPYTNQDTSWSNKFASAWQLNKITLPSGGSIRIQYEADDYAYVQDKRASQMCMLNGVGSQGSSTGLIGADYIYVNLPRSVSNSKEMNERYFEGITNLYYKFFIDLDAQGHKEFVPGYAELDGKPELVGTNIAKIKLKKQKDINPIAKEGWQFIRTNLPKYAYPGSDNLDDGGTDLQKTLRAMVAAFGSIKELIQGFDGRAKRKNFSNTVELGKSWVRLASPDRKKIGGGSRVKRIEVADDWAAMSGATGAESSVYSQVYQYTTQGPNGSTISSGVASYEPSIGNDENPLRQPIRYKQNQFLGLNNYYYIEEPFCESLYPGASVGYSKVTVRSVGSGEADNVNRTGSVVSEFYTAKEFPVKVEILGIEKRKPATSKIFKLIGGLSYDMTGVSQGYSISLNDMHGKPKSVNVFNKSGQNISSVEYFYKTTNENAPQKELSNEVKIIKPDGSVTDGIIGMDAEMFTDMREQTTDNIGESLKISGGVGAIFIFPLPFFFPGFGVNCDLRSYRSSSTIKIVNRFAIQYKTRKVENGSSITSENLLWDAETGNVLLTKTQNEFDDPVYSFAYPAHWKYDGMGQAYKNLGTLFLGLSTSSSGEITNSTYNNLLVPGDELIDIVSANKYWVINSPVSSTYNKRIIDSTGNIKQLTFKHLKLIRSGRRNMANTAIATISSLKNPIVGNKLDVTQLTKVLDAKATVFSEEWSVPVSNTTSAVTAAAMDYCELYNTSRIIFQYVLKPHYSSPDPYPIRELMFSNQGAGETMYSVIDEFQPAPFLFHYPSLSDSSFYGTPLDEVDYYVNEPRFLTTDTTNYYYFNAGDTVTLGDYKMVFESVDTTFNKMINFRYNAPLCGPGVVIYSNYNPVEGFCYYSVKAEFETEGLLKKGNTKIASRTNHPYPMATAFCINNNKGGNTMVNCNSSMIANSSSCEQVEIALIKVFKTTIQNVCAEPIGNIINPYYKGILGNWRAKSQYAYQVTRDNRVSDPGLTGSTDIRNSGAYSVFNPFYKYSGSVWQQNPTNDIRWVAANEVTYFNSKGLELENKDALNRYSSALFGYLQSMPVAVASNTRYWELAYDGFEDYGFRLACNESVADSCNIGHFSFKELLNGSSVDTTRLYAHSGKYSLLLSNSSTLTKTVHTAVTDSIFGFDNLGRYKLLSNELSKGFSPIPGKKYVLSFWVKDGQPRDPTTDVQAIVNGTNLINSAVNWPVVEGWKHVEVPFIFPGMASSFSLELEPNEATVYLDDIRIFPFDGQMKSFAYDASTQRLMAELDENNFATFYEYDDEGILIRVKKETEKGIMTIKETRSSYKKRQ